MRLVLRLVLSLFWLSSLWRVATTAFAQGVDDSGGIGVKLTIDPAQPLVGQPATVSLSFYAVGGAMPFVLLRSYPIVALGPGAASLSAEATIPPSGPGGVYTTVLVFPAAGAWHISSTAFSGSPGNDLAVVVQPAAAGCQFRFGFASIHDAIPSRVGDCLDNEAYSANGDSTQHTTRGLLAWRKADNLAAFTDGYWTWVLGPSGLQQRLN